MKTLKENEKKDDQSEIEDLHINCIDHEHQVGDEIDSIYSIRKSNCLFSQMIVSVYSLTFFSMIGLLLNIISKEINMKEANLRSVNANIDPYEESEED